VAKRGQNEGSIFKRKDGRWVAILNIGYRDGARRRKHFYGNTRRDVQERLTAALRAQQQGLPVAPERQTLGDFLRHWLDHVVRPNLRPKTHHSYAAEVRLHIGPQLGHIQLAKLRPQHIQAFLNEKREAGLSARTVQYHHAILRRALGQAEKWDLVPRNVAALVTPPTIRRREIEPLQPDEALTLLDAVRDDRLEAVYSVALAVGLRQGEILGLRWRDVDLENGKLEIRTSLLWLDGACQLSEPKTDRSRRSIALPEVATMALHGHRARQLEDKLIAGTRWREHDLVFATTLGTPMHPRNLVRHYHRALAKAGLPRKRFHDLRHTCASLLLAQGVQPRVVMEILGHSQIALTMDTYSHVIPSLKRDAANSMDKALGR
jgi:integrase